MRKLIATTVAGAILATSMVAVTTPADAQRWGRGGYRGGWHGGYGYRRGWRGGGGAAVAAGIIGLGVGAAIASDRGYRGGYYGPGPGYYGAGPVGYYGYGGCRTSWRWDGYYGDYVPVRACW